MMPHKSSDALFVRDNHPNLLQVRWNIQFNRTKKWMTIIIIIKITMWRILFRAFVFNCNATILNYIVIVITFLLSSLEFVLYSAFNVEHHEQSMKMAPLEDRFINIFFRIRIRNSFCLSISFVLSVFQGILIHAWLTHLHFLKPSRNHLDSMKHPFYQTACAVSENTKKKPIFSPE